MSLWYRPWFWGVVGGVLGACAFGAIQAISGGSGVAVLWTAAAGGFGGLLGGYFGYGITQRRLAKSAEERDEGDRGQE